MYFKAAVVPAMLVALLPIAAVIFVFWRGDDTQIPGKNMAEGRQLYLENCAACHGEALEGQPQWRERLSNGRMPAPPHDETGHTWHHSDEQLFRITRDGVAAIVGGDYQSDMPGFGEVLSDDDIWAVLDYIKSTWPEREREYQADMSARDN
ncbi:c-type cytochrome [Pelagibacterium lentulum]|jgi:mono/diheme cytochrome c family protein|uniref:Cytochrome c n=1 Tax=Pelagibacterium lentulum TaxID=2029865 RepID=A0A916RPQ6_9HYPH|nr:cytochrome c [Pelagibacterium lentulum]GGA65220.1 cytochrome c [Pelagibacterium lentulum]